MRRLARLGYTPAARATAIARGLLTLERVIVRPLRFGSKGASAPGEPLRRSQARIA
jgi:hypothetical protein